MKLYLLVTMFFIVGFSSEEEKIPWSATERLTWTDFRGAPNSSGEYVASTNSGISFGFSYSERNGVGKVDITIVSNFYPDLSWYRPDTVSEYILAHEQTHFDITEIHARKLRKRLSTLPHNREYKDKASTIYNAIEAERRAMQRKYDGETDHSNAKEMEYKWREFVKQQLIDYNNWK